MQMIQRAFFVPPSHPINNASLCVCRWRQNILIGLVIFLFVRPLLLFTARFEGYGAATRESDHPWSRLLRVDFDIDKQTERDKSVTYFSSV